MLILCIAMIILTKIIIEMYIDKTSIWYNNLKKNEINFYLGISFIGYVIHSYNIEKMIKCNNGYLCFL